MSRSSLSRNSATASLIMSQASYHKSTPAKKPKSALPRRAAPDAAASEKSGERIAKVIARAGLASRREAEQWIAEGRVAVNGDVIKSPALNISSSDRVAVDGKP